MRGVPQNQLSYFTSYD